MLCHPFQNVPTESLAEMEHSRTPEARGNLSMDYSNNPKLHESAESNHTS